MTILIRLEILIRPLDRFIVANIFTLRCMWYQQKQWVAITSSNK